MHLCRTIWGPVVLVTAILLFTTAASFAAVAIAGSDGTAEAAVTTAHTGFIQHQGEARIGSDAPSNVQIAGFRGSLLALLAASMGTSVLLAVALRSEPGQLIR